MIEWLLSGNNSIGYMGLSIVAFVVMLIFVGIFSNHEKIQDVIGFFGIFILIQGFIVPIICFTAPVKNETSDWSTVYTDGDNKKFTIDLGFGSYFGTITNKELGETYTVIAKHHHGTITIDDNNAHGKYSIEINPENIIENKKLNKQSKIVKIEYRRYKSQYREWFGFKSDTIDKKFKYDGELRLTFDDGDPDIKKLFKH